MAKRRDFFDKICSHLDKCDRRQTGFGLTALMLFGDGSGNFQIDGRKIKSFHSRYQLENFLNDREGAK